MKRILLLAMLTGCSQSQMQAVEQPEATAAQPNKEQLVRDLQPVTAPISPVERPQVMSMQAMINTESRWDRTQNARVSLLLTNTSEKTLSYTIRSGMMADFSLSKDGEVLWRYSDDMMFTQALSEFRLGPLAERRVSIVVSTRSLNQLEPGTYYLHARLNSLDDNAVRIKPVLVELF